VETVGFRANDKLEAHLVAAIAWWLNEANQEPLAERVETELPRRNAALVADIHAIPNIHAAVKALHQATAGRIACASGADRFKVEMMLAQVGLADYFAGKVFSGHEMPRSKPHPDVYLAAAAHLRVDPARCAVVEDTSTGVRAGVSAGATVFAYAPAGGTQALLEAGAHQVFGDMAALPGLLC